MPCRTDLHVRQADVQRRAAVGLGDERLRHLAQPLVRKVQAQSLHDRDAGVAPRRRVPARYRDRKAARARAAVPAPHRS